MKCIGRIACVFSRLLRRTAETSRFYSAGGFHRLDNSSGIGQNIPNEVKNATEQSKKTPWFLRFAESFDSKSIVQIAGIGTLYGVLFAGLLLMPLPRRLEMQASVRPDASPPCSFTQFLVTPGYGSSLEPTGGFSGYICYEQYDDFIKCLSKVDNAYRTALQNAEDDRRGCSFKCTLGILGGGLGCFIFAIVTIGSGAVPCNIAIAGGGAGCLAYCRIDLATARKKAANNADGAIQDCIIEHSPTDNQRRTIPNHGNILLDDRLWKAY